MTPSPAFALLSVLALSAVLTSCPAQASVEGDQLLGLVRNGQFLRLNGMVFETQNMRGLYANASEPLWIRRGVLTPMGQALKAMLRNAGRHGLDAKEYWSPTLEALAQDPRSSVSAEILATDALLKYSRDLSVGRFDPDVVDDDIKFTRKAFDPAVVAAAIAQGPERLQAAIDDLAPKMPLYGRLMKALGDLRAGLANGTAKAFPAIDKELRPGSAHPAIALMKTRLKLLGYAIADNSSVYTPDLGEAIKQFQADNNLGVTTTLSAGSPTVSRLGGALDSRLRSLEISMEKLRWLPTTLEPKHVFVNLAFQHFRLYENDKVVLSMKTVNGRPVRRTPLMHDAIHTVEFNPTWTVPMSIAVKDKLPHLQQDPDYLRRLRLKVYDSETWQEVNPDTIDWTSLDKTNFPYYLEQQPGNDNALGVMKFHLSNPWAIYFHDTNERQLFKQNFRLLSSGCVRLERPLDLALYLLRDNPQWTEQNIRAILYKGIPGEVVPTKVRVKLATPLPVYLMSLLADVTDDGHLRFAEDYYGQDMRIARTLNAPAPQFAGAGNTVFFNFGNGALRVNGTPGPSQVGAKVIAIRCDPRRRGACDAPITMELNQQREMQPGDYLVGFENSLFPGWVSVGSRRLTDIDLVKIVAPAQASGQGPIKIFRDLTSAVEQRKFAWAYFQLGRHPFGEAVYDFGDFYPAALNQRDVTGRLNDDYCASLSQIDEATDEAKEVCDVQNGARSFESTLVNFKFSPDSTVMQSWVVPPGDRVQVKLRRHLVSGPIKDGEFVSVFPGAYRAIGERQKSSTPISTGQIRESY